MISPERLELLQRSWVLQLGRLGVQPADAYRLFDDLAARYQEPHRHYHNLEHIGEVLKVIGKLGDQAGDPHTLYLAAWYHDAIYDPRARDNEDCSADLAITSLTPLSLETEMLDRIGAMIRATAHTGAAAEGDAAIMLDADLAILGAEEKRYARYAQAIRDEYSWVEDDAYRAGRARVLESFLKRERIYRTQRMFETGEQSARENLQRELAQLGKRLDDATSQSPH
jgi:predicted metal-dependent HD superfamily phosphohydrolase